MKIPCPNHFPPGGVGGGGPVSGTPRAAAETPRSIAGPPRKVDAAPARVPLREV